jgi:hypothetical protein
MALGQSNVPHTCSFQKSNDAWIKTFNAAETMAERIDLVRDKIMSDAVYLTLQKEAATAQGLAEPTLCCCPIRFGMIYGNRRGFTIDLSKQPELEALIEALSDDTIDEIQLNEFERNKIHRYAPEACSGVTLFSSSRELRRIIRDVM